MDLIELGHKHGTDKFFNTHSFNGRSYLDIYENNLKQLKDSKIKFLEIGVYNGCSLRMWKEYFSNGEIYGLDIDPNTKIHQEERVRIDIGSQTDIEFLKETYKNEQFDVIIDDGSHVNEFTIKSFNYLFYNHLKNGGLYIIEDLHCTFELADHTNNIWPGMSYNKELSNENGYYVNDRKVFNEFINKILENLDNSNGEIFSVKYFSKTAIIEKIK